MKLILSVLSVAFLSGSLALAEGDCGKCKKDCEKKEQGTIIACDKHKQDGDKDKDAPSLADCGKCKKKCDDEKKTEGTLAAEGCGKCKKGDDDTKKSEGTLA